MTELDVLARAETPYIIDFLGAFHNRSSIFLCLEYMDAGSMEQLFQSGGPLPENVLAAMAYSVQTFFLKTRSINIYVGPTGNVLIV